MKYFSFFISLFLVLIINVNALDTYSQNVYLYNLDEEKVIYEENSTDEVAIASLTKIMTAIVTIENISLDEEVTIITADFKSLASENASVAGFYVGEKLTVKDLLYGLMLPSGADAAQALTRVVAGSKEDFVNLMNELASRLGMNHTSFVNETGLDADGAYSTAEDVAILLKYALQNETFYEIFTTKEYTTSDNYLTLKSSLAKLSSKYSLDTSYILGAKTGTTEDAGLCLASIAYYNGTNYLLITLGASDNLNIPTHIMDAITIYSCYMENYHNITVFESNEIILSLDTYDTVEESVDFYLVEDLIKYLPNTYSSDDISIDYEGVNVVDYQVNAGTTLGTISIYYQDELIKTMDIVLENKLTFSLEKFLNNRPYFYIIGGIIIFSLILIIILKIVRSVANERKKVC